MENIIKKIVAIPDLYGRFLNTLSLMEYVGAKKILKSQKYQNLNKKILSHIAEEIRHAQILKQAAINIFPKCSNYTAEELLCGEEAYQYFQTTDYAAKKVLNEQDSWNCYLYTTFLIETRILIFYQAFTKILFELKQPNVFHRVLLDEEKHLAEVSEQLFKLENGKKNVEILKRVEEVAFGKFLLAIEKIVG